MATAELKTLPFDSRFPNQNQTSKAEEKFFTQLLEAKSCPCFHLPSDVAKKHKQNCWQNYVDYYRCLKIKGETYAPCEYFKKAYTALCPNEWIETYDAQREKNVFAGKI